MADIHPIPTPEPTPPIKLSPFKVGVFSLIVAGVALFGIFGRYIMAPEGIATSSQVLGEETSSLASSSEAHIADGLTLPDGTKVNPEGVFLTGRELVGSAASALTEEAVAQTEKVASDAAHNITNFVYKNTIERMIDTLIKSLPEERRQQYVK